MRRWRSVSSIALSLAVLSWAAGAVQACGSFTAADGPTEAAEGGVDAPLMTDDAPSPTVDGAGGVESGAGFCAAHTDAALCSDFDGMNELGGWNLEMPAGAVVETDSALFLSPPRSLRTVLSSVVPAGQTFTAARLTRPIPANATRVRVSFDFQLGQGALQTGQEVSIVEVYCSGAAPNEGAWIFLEDASFAVVAHAGADGDVTTPLAPLAPTGWTHIVLDAHFDKMASTADITIGAANAAAVSVSSTCASDATFELRVGLSTYTKATLEGFFDNVLYELNPP